jgi:hypothetical protein
LNPSIGGAGPAIMTPMCAVFLSGIVSYSRQALPATADSERSRPLIPR